MGDYTRETASEGQENHARHPQDISCRGTFNDHAEIDHATYLEFPKSRMELPHAAGAPAEHPIGEDELVQKLVSDQIQCLFEGNGVACGRDRACVPGRTAAKPCGADD